MTTPGQTIPRSSDSTMPGQDSAARRNPWTPTGTAPTARASPPGPEGPTEHTWESLHRPTSWGCWWGTAAALPWPTSWTGSTGSSRTRTGSPSMSCPCHLAECSSSREPPMTAARRRARLLTPRWRRGSLPPSPWGTGTSRSLLMRGLSPPLRTVSGPSPWAR